MLSCVFVGIFHTLHFIIPVLHFYRGCNLTDVSIHIFKYLDKREIDHTVLVFLLFRLYPLVYATTTFLSYFSISRFQYSPKWSTLRCWHLGWSLWICCLSHTTQTFTMSKCAPAFPSVPTAFHLFLQWLGVCLCVSSIWGRTWFPPSLSCAICVPWHASECCVWLKTPVAEQIPPGIACLCCAAFRDCRSSTTKVSPVHVERTENSRQHLLGWGWVGQTCKLLGSLKVVTEEELAMALVEGEEVTTPPDGLKNQLPSNGLPDADAENDPQYYNMKETK